MKNFSQWQFEQADTVVPTSDVATSAPEGVDSAPYISARSPASTQHNIGTTVSKLKAKPWKASKDQIMSFWKGLQPSTALALNPIEYDHKGSTIQEDGIRITGSKEFITTVLSRLKDFITYENPQTKLMVAYRQSPKSFLPGHKNSFIFYLQTKKRGTD